MAVAKKKRARVDRYRPVTREDVTDIALLPRRFDLFAAEVRTSLELLGEKVIQTLARIERAQLELARRLDHVEQRAISNTERIEALEATNRRRKKNP